MLLMSYPLVKDIGLQFSYFTLPYKGLGGI